MVSFGKMQGLYASTEGDREAILVTFKEPVLTFKSLHGSLTISGVAVVKKELAFRLCLGSSDAQELAGVVSDVIDLGGVDKKLVYPLGRRYFHVSSKDGIVSVSSGGRA